RHPGLSILHAGRVSGYLHGGFVLDEVRSGPYLSGFDHAVLLTSLAPVGPAEHRHPKSATAFPASHPAETFPFLRKVSYLWRRGQAGCTAECAFSGLRRLSALSGCAAPT